MTRKEYELIAASLRLVKPYGRGSDAAQQWWTDVYAIASTLAADNPRFDRALFYDAVGAP